ncbi:hypothetical protein [Aureliella helgolandensis]|uniref:hypothetical protein n=1 Tax=Aureliella helgolandensis TaxID=2527968 RepID=UPI0018D01BB9|nr:hypothetical protein [Aureliella helgolandensis]
MPNLPWRLFLFSLLEPEEAASRIRPFCMGGYDIEELYCLIHCVPAISTPAPIVELNG